MHVPNESEALVFLVLQWHSVDVLRSLMIILYSRYSGYFEMMQYIVRNDVRICTTLWKVRFLLFYSC